ncbi:MAG: hypothetical protein WBA97_22090 [Actinophytocola sp.]|uniref:hypothetical protein n=1 Tax=Actinophytocola sp. TaxID=1872138 RepID=UPI003C77DE2B
MKDKKHLNGPDAATNRSARRQVIRRIGLLSALLVITGALASWSVVSAIVVSAVLVLGAVIRSLRRASRHIDRILDEERKTSAAEERAEAPGRSRQKSA